MSGRAFLAKIDEASSQNGNPKASASSQRAITGRSQNTTRSCVLAAALAMLGRYSGDPKTRLVTAIWRLLGRCSSDARAMLGGSEHTTSSCILAAGLAAARPMLERSPGGPEVAACTRQMGVEGLQPQGYKNNELILPGAKKPRVCWCPSAKSLSFHIRNLCRADQHLHQ